MQLQQFLGATAIDKQGQDAAFMRIAEILQGRLPSVARSKSLNLSARGNVGFSVAGLTLSAMNSQ